MSVVRKEEYEQLCRTIQNWNENRLELFEISLPKEENLEFEGVMRFYFQSAECDGQKVATKCIRVSSTSTTAQVVEALVQKFRPDLRMLTTPSLYSLYEVHADGEERMLEKNEYPLCVQLNWVEGNREGRFLLKKMAASNGVKLSSKKDKKNKEDKKKSKTKHKSEGFENVSNQEQGSIARSLYTDMPESRLTRSVSLKQGNMRIVHSESGNNSMDMEVNVSADLLPPDTPCKSFFVGDKDTAAQVVCSALEKYEIRDDPAKFCLVQVIVPNVPVPSGSSSVAPINVQVVEKMLEDADLPLLIYTKWAAATGGGGALQFQLRRRPGLNQSKVPPGLPSGSSGPLDADALSKYPILVEVIQTSAGVPPSNPRTFPLTTSPAEIGSDPKCCVHLVSGGIKPRHCVIASGDGGSFTIAPLDKAAMIQLNNKLVKAYTVLPNSSILKIGDTDTFQFLVPLSSLSASSGVAPVPQRTVEPRRNSRQSLQGAANLSKAFSSEDILNPSTTNSLKRPLKERAFSEFNLPGDGSPPEQGLAPERNTPAVELKGARVSSTDAMDCADLPASLFFYHAKGQLLLQTLILDVKGYTLQFKLGPAFALYMMARCYLSPDFQPGVSTAECKKNLIVTLKNVAANIKRAIKDNRNIAGPLAFWLANTSELLHFLKRDRQLSLLSHEYSNLLTQLIRVSYRNFTEYMLRELTVTISAFLDETSDADNEDTAYVLSSGEGDAKEPDVVPTTAQSQLAAQTAIYWSVSESRMRRRGRATMGDVLFTLNSTLALLQSCRVNATLCVLIFSTLFHHISTKLFNKLVTEPARYCSTNIGVKLGKRVDRIVTWAEIQGMEIPAQEHLTLIMQAASLLRVSKDSSQDAQKIFSTCANLNSLQMNTLLIHCKANEGEGVVSEAVIDALITMATMHADKQLQAEGHTSIQLEEDVNFELKSHVPDNGYYCDGLVGVPPGLQEYLQSAVSAGLCKLNINSDACGNNWVSPHTSDLSHSLEMLGENVHSSTLPRSLGHSQKSQDVLESTGNFCGSSTLPRQPPRDSRIVQLTISKEGANNTLGISITGGKGSAYGDVGIYIKSLTVGGAAQVDGRLSRGDQILMVDGQSLEGVTQQQAANILRSTGKTITLTVSKHAAYYQGHQDLISHSSPHSARQNMNIPEGTSHAQKAKRRQRRERAQQYGGDPRLDSRKVEDIPEQSVPQHTTDVTKWLLEQRDLAHSHNEDHCSSTSTLSNIPEQERPLSPTGPSSTRLGLGERRSTERHGVSTPPVRDSGLLRTHDSDSSTFSSLVQLETASMEASTKYSGYSQDLDYHRQPPVVGPGGSFSAQPLPHHSSSLTYSDVFNLSSQSALQSQSIPPVMSQQRPTAQDRLSMDVLQHTQPSSASLSGVGAVLAKIKASSSVIGGKDDTHFLLSSDLKGLEMDEIELEKQRIHLLLYEEQKEKETSKEKQLLLEEPYEVSEEGSRLQKELLSIENLIVEQKKKIKDAKYNREREEQKLKEIEKEMQNSMVVTALLTGDQQRQYEQKQRRIDLDQRKRYLSGRIQNLLENEHNAKTKLLALEANAEDTRKQLQQYKKCSAKDDLDLGSKGTISNGGRALQQEDEFSEKGSDVPRPGSPPVAREDKQLKMPDLDAGRERQYVNPSWSVSPGLPRDVVGSRGSTNVSKAMSASDLSEPSEDVHSRPAKWSTAYDNAPCSTNLPRISEQYGYKSHSRDEIDDISKGQARGPYEKPRNASVEGMLALTIGEHSLNGPASPQQEPQSRGEGRYYRNREPYEGGMVGAGRSNSSSAWYQPGMPSHSFQRPSSADSRSDSPSAYSRPEQGPPSAYNRSDQGQFDQGPPGAYNRPMGGRPDQQAPSRLQNRVDPSPTTFAGKPDQGSRPSSASSNHRSDFESTRVPANSRSDASGRLGHHYSRQTKSRAMQRSMNQSSSADNLIETTETAGGGVARQVGTPDVVPSVRGERFNGVSGRALEGPTSAFASRENDVTLSSSDVSSPHLSHGKHESDVPPLVPGCERMRSMTFGGVGNPASRPVRPYEQITLQHSRVVPQGYLQDQVAVPSPGKPYGQVPASQVKPYESVALGLQPKLHEPSRPYSATTQGRPYEQTVAQHEQQGRLYGMQGQPGDQMPQSRLYDPSVQQGRSYDQPLPQGKSYDHAPRLQGRPYEQVMPGQGKSHDNVPMQQGRSYEQASVAHGNQGRSYEQASIAQGNQGRSYEQPAMAQSRAHNSTLPASLQGRSYDPVTTQRRSYEQFVLLQSKPQEQSWVAQPSLSGRPYDSATLPPGQTQGQRTSSYERTLLGGDLMNVGRNPAGYPSKAGSHSYSRRRPDPPQQVMTVDDKVKHYIEGMEEPSYPDRIQRQQTEL